MNDLRITYMGTPEFAVPSLQILVENGYNVVAVVTAPDRPKGRGQKLATTPVKDYAVSQNIPLLQPTNLKSTEFVLPSVMSRRSQFSIKTILARAKLNSPRASYESVKCQRQS